MALLNRFTVNLTGDAAVGGGTATHYFNALVGTPQQAADAVADFWAYMDTYMSDAVAWSVDPEVAIIEATTALQVDVTFVTGGSGIGADGTGELPPVIQGLARWRTGVFVGGRELRGRTFLPGMVKGLVTSTGGVHGTLIEAIETAGNALIADTDSQLVIYSPTHKEFAAVTDCVAWNKFAELRSRRD